MSPYVYPTNDPVPDFLKGKPAIDSSLTWGGRPGVVKNRAFAYPTGMARVWWHNGEIEGGHAFIVHIVPASGVPTSGVFTGGAMTRSITIAYAINVNVAAATRRIS